MSVFEEKISKQIKESLLEALKNGNKKYDSLMVDFYINEFSVNTLATFKWWLKHPQVSSEKIAEMIFNVAMLV